jgi:hypothetical protein
MRMRRLAAGTAASILIAAGLAMAGVAPASADQVWHQSVGRPSADAPCPTSDAADLEAGWSAWTGSWEQWANDGTGGWTCSRSITWAKDSPPPAAAGDPVMVSNCLAAEDAGPDVGLLYLQFGADDSLPPDTVLYSDNSCLEVSIYTTGLWFVTAANDDAAQVICDRIGGGGIANPSSGDARVFYCS